MHKLIHDFFRLLSNLLVQTIKMSTLSPISKVLSFLQVILRVSFWFRLISKYYMYIFLHATKFMVTFQDQWRMAESDWSNHCQFSAHLHVSRLRLLLVGSLCCYFFPHSCLQIFPTSLSGMKPQIWSEWPLETSGFLWQIPLLKLDTLHYYKWSCSRHHPNVGPKHWKKADFNTHVCIHVILIFFFNLFFNLLGCPDPSSNLCFLDQSLSKYLLLFSDSLQIISKCNIPSSLDPGVSFVHICFFLLFLQLHFKVHNFYNYHIFH